MSVICVATVVKENSPQLFFFFFFLFLERRKKKKKKKIMKEKCPLLPRSWFKLEREKIHDKSRPCKYWRVLVNNLHLYKRKLFLYKYKKKSFKRALCSFFFLYINYKREKENFLLLPECVLHLNKTMLEFSLFFFSLHKRRSFEFYDIFTTIVKISQDPGRLYIFPSSFEMKSR